MPTFKHLPWAYEFPDYCIMDEADTVTILYVNENSPMDFSNECLKALNDVVSMANDGKTLMEIDAMLLDDGRVTQDEREVIIEELYKFAIYEEVAKPLHITVAELIASLELVVDKTRHVSIETSRGLIKVESVNHTRTYNDLGLFINKANFDYLTKA